MSNFLHKKCQDCHNTFPIETLVCPHDGNQLETTLLLSPVGHTLVGRYRIDCELGRGGMGIIYRATDIQAEDPAKARVALKLLVADAAASEPLRNRFMIEAKAAGSLEHPNIVKVHEYGMSEEGLPFMVMEYLDGASLSSLIDKAPLAPELSLKFIIELCDALAHAHHRHVVHRDLKPSNIMIVEEGGEKKAVLVDFGIAKVFTQPGQVSLRLTQTGEVFGSPLYMSPEQCMGQKIDHRSDIYSLGCVLYECLTGRSPFEGENFLNVIFKHVNEYPPEFANKASERAIEDVVLKALAKHPDDRYINMTAFRQHLEQCLALLGKSEAEVEKYFGQSEPVQEDTPEDERFLYTLRLAEQGFAPAQLDLAYTYDDGVVVEKNLELAFDWCLKAATHGLADAQAMLGDLFKNGEGIASDPEKAAYWYAKAAEQGHRGAMAALGSLYRQGLGVEASIDKAIEWYTRSAELDDESAQYLLALFYLVGDEVEKNEKLALKWFERAGQQGNAEAQYQAGLCYIQGMGTQIDAESAFYWFRLAGEQGVAPAQYELSVLYEQGLGTTQDKALALKWMKESHFNGYEWATLVLGQWYADGINGLQQDHKRAVNLFREAAEQDVTTAMYWLGYHYQMGLGVSRCNKTAAHWFKKAAHDKNSSAMLALARLVMDGLGVKQDVPEALRLLKASAALQNENAELELGCYYQKQGQNQEAAYWLKQALEHGAAEAAEYLRKLPAPD